MTPRRAARVDSTQAAIVEALRAAGASVIVLSSVGQGCPDILCGYNPGLSIELDGDVIPIELNILMEIKSDTGKLTPDQVEWHAAWRGQVAIVRSVEEALQVIGR